MLGAYKSPISNCSPSTSTKAFKCQYLNPEDPWGYATRASKQNHGNLEDDLQFEVAV